MSKSRNNRAKSQAEKLPEKSRSRRLMFIIAAILIGLLVTGGALAQWSGIWSVPQQSQQKDAELAPANFSIPAKEYIYAGGKLLATEEPQGTTCSYALSTTTQSFAANGGSGQVSVTAGAGCLWTVISNANWITITSGVSGNGNGAVNFTVAAHSNISNRSGTITVTGGANSLPFTVLQGAAFLDVSVGHPFYDEIGKLSARGVTTGCGSGNYCPDAVVTREQMAAFIIRALGEFNPPMPGSQRFADVPPSNPFYSFIERMAVLNITQGCGGSNYCPTATVSREQMAAFLMRAKGEFTPPLPPNQRFNDVPPTNPFYNFIDRLAVLNITQGCSPSPPLYCPTGVVTRAQMAAFLVRAFNL